MYTLHVDKSDLTESNLINQGPRARAPVAVEADGIVLTGSPESPSRDEFVPDLCQKLLLSVDSIGAGEAHTVSFSSSVCELSYIPQGDGTVVVTATDATGEPLNADLAGREISVPESAVIEEHLRVSIDCYRAYRALALPVSRHPDISCLFDAISERRELLLERGILERPIERPELPSIGRDCSFSALVTEVECSNRGLGCEQQLAVLENGNGVEFGVFDSSRNVASDHIGRRRELDIWGFTTDPVQRSMVEGRKILPNSRGEGWENHTFRGVVLDSVVDENWMGIVLDVGQECIPVVSTDVDGSTHVTQGDAVSIRADFTELVS